MSPELQTRCCGIPDESPRRGSSGRRKQEGKALKDRRMELKPRKGGMGGEEFSVDHCKMKAQRWDSIRHARECSSGGFLGRGGGEEEAHCHPTPHPPALSSSLSTLCPAQVPEPHSEQAKRSPNCHSGEAGLIRWNRHVGEGCLRGGG